MARTEEPMKNAPIDKASTSRELPSVSVVVCTLGRTTEVDALLTSLEQSSVAPYEVIIVDQNCGDFLDAVVAQHAAGLPIQHLKVCTRGISRARNYGARFATGEVLSFPDDDSELFPDTIAKGLEILTATQCPVVYGRSLNSKGKDAVAPFNKKAGHLTLEAHEGMFIEFTVFVRKATFDAYPCDETLGTGVFHGAEEAHDQVLRMLHAGVPLYYSPEIEFYHPTKINQHASPQEIRRVFSYRCGFSRLCMKHRLYSKFFKRLIKVALYLGYLSLFNRRKARYYGAELLGLLAGVVVP